MSVCSCEDDSMLRLEFWCRLPWHGESRPGESIERFDERWRLECFSLTFGEPIGEPLPIDGLRLDFFCLSLPRGGNEESWFPAGTMTYHYIYWGKPVTITINSSTLLLMNFILVSPRREDEMIWLRWQQMSWVFINHTEGYKSAIFGVVRAWLVKNRKGTNLLPKASLVDYYL